MHSPTPEQALIVGYARTTSDNLLVNALAGAAKTTTLEMVCHAITSIPILSLAFNKRIADEMAKRLPGHVEVRTLNALGHRVWARVIGKTVSIDTKKMHTILTTAIRALPRFAQEEAWEDMADTLRWLRLAKRDGYVPHRWRSSAKFHMQDWLAPYPEEPTSSQCELIETAMNASIEASYAGGLDFDDQIYMPVCFGASWPRFPLVLIDEFQDLNDLQHEMLANLAIKRLIGVGDPWQSIYGFRGAKQNGMAAARERWNMRELTLSTTFRVPRLGVERAWFRVPHMRWRDGAPEGHIVSLEAWNENDIPDGSAIICRNNAPLFRAGLRLLSRGRHIKLIGMDIGAGLLRILKKLGPPEMNHQQMLGAIERWQSTALISAKSEETVYDKAECLRVLTVPQHDDWRLRHALSRAESLFKQNGPIQLMSGHKAKGLEYETVFHLDPWRIPSRFAQEGSEEWEQELNVRYVIESRFKQNLFLVNSDGWT
jgi:superfamily I DNA/RNA helicase